MKFIAIATIAVLSAVPALAQECVVGLVSAEWNDGQKPFSFVQDNPTTVSAMTCADARAAAAVLNARHNNGDQGVTPVEAKVYRLLSS